MALSERPEGPDYTQHVRGTQRVSERRLRVCLTYNVEVASPGAEAAQAASRPANAGRRAAGPSFAIGADGALRGMQVGKPWLLDDAHNQTPRMTVGEFIAGEAGLGMGTSVFPEVVRTLETIFTGGHDEAVLCWGIGSGKSFLGSLALCYMAHCVLCLRAPQRSLGMAPGSAITLLVAAPSERLARDVVFAEVSRRVRESAWFQRHAPEAQHLASELRLPKDLAIVAGSSSPTFPLGYNVLGAVIDEAAWFTTAGDEGKETVEEVYHALKRRVTSRFMGRGLVLLISSPRTAGDFMARRLAAAAGDEKLYASRKAVWEVRPAESYSGRRFTYDGVEVPVEHRREFDLNPRKALRDLAARPTHGVDAFLCDPAVLEAAIDPALAHPLDDAGRLWAWFRPADALPRHVHVDLGLTRDACGFAMARCETDEARSGAPRVVVELMHRLAAPPNGEVELSRPREIILALRDRGFNIAQASYDGWQSADSRQILRKRGIATKTVSVDRTPEAYETLKELLLDGRLRVYRHEWFLREMAQLEFVAGAKVDHPPGGSKDVADAVAGAVSEAVRNWGGGEVRGRVV